MSSVLIVDDALFMRQLIRQALEPLGFTISGEADRGEEALKLFSQKNPDLITLDIVMPEMDGLTVLSKLRQISNNVKVIMITALDQREPMLKAMKLGVSDFIVKPFTDDRVISAAEKALGKNIAF